MASKIPIRWCAVYTRKSSEEGLEQEFNSLDAQREAGAAYIKSQEQEGWRLIETRYDDGGYSGGTLERPALQRLLGDIRDGRVHTVVVYKVDRLTRSLNDFARLIEVFEAHSVSFVSVTQQFNTTTSMGRLMLNVLLSFAQFEREVTSERIRDKIAASKKKGMWMGGRPPIGYDVQDRKLVVNEAEAKTVRHIFRRYAELGRVSRLMRELKDEGHRTKRHTSSSGRTSGGRAFSRGHLYRLLNNRIYLGEIVHKEVSYPGEHEAVVGPELWDRAHAVLEKNRHEILTDNRFESPSLLKGLLFDDAGNRMTPSHARKGRCRYRYYVSQAILQHRQEEAGSQPRLPAHDLEKLVADTTLEVLADDERTRIFAARFEGLAERERHTFLRRILQRAVVAKGMVRITIDPSHANGEIDGRKSLACGPDPGPITLKVSFEVVQRGGSARIVWNGNASALAEGPNPVLIKAVARSYLWRQELLSGAARTISDIATREGVTGRYVSRILRLGFLAPDIMEAILNGTHPPDLSLEQLRNPIPFDWKEQRRLLGFPSA